MIELKTIVMPKELFNDKNLSWIEKITLSLIYSYRSKDNVFTYSNKEIGEAMKLSKDRVSRILNGLDKKGYIDSKMIYKPGTKQIDHRELKILKWGE